MFYISEALIGLVAWAEWGLRVSDGSSPPHENNSSADCDALRNMLRKVFYCVVFGNNDTTMAKHKPVCEELI